MAVEPDEAEMAAVDYDYARALAHRRKEIDDATLTLRRYAEAIEPLTLETMREEYYHYTNDMHYLVTNTATAVVTASLNSAWNGVGPWKR